MGKGTNEISEAVVLYLGVGTSSTPARNRDNLVGRFGVKKAVLLESQVRSLLDEVMAIEIDWRSNSLLSGGQLAATQMRQRHPELSADAVDALKWEFSWNWR